MGVNLGSAFGKIEISSNIPKTVQESQRAMADLSGSSGRLKGALAGAFSFAGGLGIVAGIQGITSAVSASVGTAIDAYADYERLGQSLESLVAREIAAADSTKTVEEAMAEAGPRAEELMGWIQQLAIQSPFNQAGIADAYRGALAYGFATDEAQRLTKATLDYVAGAGLQSDAMGRIGLALGQIRAKGKVSAEELNQLREAGFDVSSVLDDMGVSLDDVSKGLVSADGFIEGVVSTMEEDFAGAAARQAGTFQGLLSSIDELKTTGLREFFTVTLQAVQPLLGGIVDALSTESTLAQIRAAGDVVGNFVNDLVQMGQEVYGLMEAFQSGGFAGEGGLLDALGVSADDQARAQAAIDGITNLSQAVADFANGAMTAYSGGGIDGLINFITTEIDAAGPTIAASIDGWSETMWNWVNLAIDAGEEKLNQWAASLLAWISNPTSQESLRGLGQTIADVILGALGLQMANQERVAGALGNLGTAIITTIPQIVGNLLLAGGQIVAGIFQGITNAITGGEYQAMTVAEFRSMAAWMISTISEMDWSAIGKSIIDGIITGLIGKRDEFLETAKTAALDAYAGVREALGINSPSKLFAGIGAGINEGLAMGIAKSAYLPADEIAAVASSLPEYASTPQSVDNSRRVENNNHFSLNIGAVQGDAATVEQSFYTLKALAM